MKNKLTCIALTLLMLFSITTPVTYAADTIPSIHNFT